jgi:transcriptional regulator with XRE-family HTH domain
LVVDNRVIAVHPIRIARAIRGLTQRDIEREAGLPKTVLSRIERGHWQPDPATQLRIAMALEEDVNDLFPRGRRQAFSS